MGIRIRSNVDASNYARKLGTDVTRGLKFIGLFDTSANKLQTDFSVASDAQLSIVGVPNVSGTGTRFTAASNFIQTNIAEPDVFSFAIVMRTGYNSYDASLDIKNRSAAFGNYGLPFSGIALGFQGSNGRLSFGREMLKNDSTVSMVSVILPSVETANWILLRGKFEGSTKKLIVIEETSGIELSYTCDASFVMPKISNNTMFIGSFHTSATSQKGPIDISQIRFADVEWTEQEFAQVVAEMRRYELIHNNRLV